MIELTVSQVLSFLRCPIRYWVAQASERTPQTPPQAVGSAAAAAGYWRVMHPKADLKELKEIALERYTEYARQSGFSEAAFIRGRQAIPGAVEAIYRHITPLPGVEAEVPVAREYRWGDVRVRLSGRVDLLTNNGVGDLKVGREIGPEENPHRRQLHMYASLVGEGRIQRVWIDNVYRSGKRWGYHRIEGAVFPADIEMVNELVHQVAIAIQAGVKTPPTELAWWCSRLWCPYWEACEHKR